MEQFCDLHTHSVYSDGTYTPRQLLEEAQRRGLGAIALTDHNTVAGLPVFLEEAKHFSVEAVAGVEFSTEYRDKELHLLGLFLPPEHFGEISAMLEEGVRAKEASNRDLAAALERAGYFVDYEKMVANSPNGQLNRAHFAAELTKKGYIPDIQTAFETLLSPKNGLYHAPRRPDVCQTIRFIHKIGGIAVIAHPFLDLKEEKAVRSFLEMTVPAGLDGMEVYHPRHNQEQRRQAVVLAREFGIALSGGSDFHGENKPDISLGVGRGDLAVPMEWVRTLRPE